MGGTEPWSEIFIRPQLEYEPTLQQASSGLPQLMQSSLGVEQCNDYLDLSS